LAISGAVLTSTLAVRGSRFVPTNAAGLANRVAHRSDSRRRVRLAQILELFERVVFLARSVARL